MYLKIRRVKFLFNDYRYSVNLTLLVCNFYLTHTTLLNKLYIIHFILSHTLISEENWTVVVAQPQYYCLKISSAKEISIIF